MDSVISDTISREVKEAVEASQNCMLSHLDSLISNKLMRFKEKISENQKDISENQFMKIQQDLLCREPHKFSRKSCEDQFKFNQKVKAKLMEVDNLVISDGQSAKTKISEGMNMLDFRQKLILLADTSESGWKAAQEYQANPIASDSDDERKMDRARARANRKMKANLKPRGRGRGRFVPYDVFQQGHYVHSSDGQPSTAHRDQSPRTQRPGTCYACGKAGHWRMECPGVLGAVPNAVGSNKLSIALLCEHVKSESVKDNATLGEVGSSSACLREETLNVMKADNALSPVGRLRRSLDFWQRAGACEFVLSVISDGYKIPFKDIPPKVFLANNRSARVNANFVQSEVQKLVSLGCVSETKVQPHVVNPLTVAFSRSGKPRLVLDCRHVNLFLHKFKFKYEDVNVVRDLFEQGDFLFTFDLKSAYHHIEIFPDHRTFLGFQSTKDGQSRFYVFNVLPFGIATVAYIFTKVLREVVKFIRSQGHKLVMYLDDGIGGQSTEGGANETSGYVHRCLADFGFIIAHEKCQWKASQQVTWLGYTWSMAEGVVRVTTDRLERLLSLLTHTMTLVSQGRLLFTARYVAGIIGQVISMQSVVGPITRLRTRELYKCLFYRASWNACVFVTAEALDEIEFWLVHLEELNSRGSKLSDDSLYTTVVCTDASASGYGGFVTRADSPLEGVDYRKTDDLFINETVSPCAGSPLEGDGCFRGGRKVESVPLEGEYWKSDGVVDLCLDDLYGRDTQVVLGTWNLSEMLMSSTWRELEAAKRVLFSIGDKIRGQNVKLWMDSKNACSIAKVGSAKPKLQVIARSLSDFSIDHEVQVYTQWVPRVRNQTADYLSRCMDCDDWSVQQWVFDKCEYMWGPHKVDRFATDYNCKCRRFNSRWWCSNTEVVDSFTTSWAGVNNWLVPPPRLICKTVGKLGDDKATGTLIVPYWKSAAFWPFLFSGKDVPREFVVGLCNLSNIDITQKGRGNNGCFGRRVLSFDMLALRLKF